MRTVEEELEKHSEQEVYEKDEEETGTQVTSCEDDEYYEEDMTIADLHNALQGGTKSDCESDFEDRNGRQIAKFCVELV